MNIDNIPDQLKQTALWCVWKREGVRGKVPYNPRTGGKVKSNNADTFSDFQVAHQAYMNGGYDGLGIGVFGNIGAIDIDHYIDDGGMLSDLASDIIERMGSYTEYSPSGHGIRIIFTVNDFVYDKDTYYINKQKLGLEVYVSGATHKFVTITGNRINDNNDVLIDGTVKLKEVLDMYMQRNSEHEQVVTAQRTDYPADHHLQIGLDKDAKLKAYWFGARLLKGESESENDLGFMAKLMYWCNNDTDKAITAFRSSPYAGQKDMEHKIKLDRTDYLPNLAVASKCERTAEQDNDKWQKRNRESLGDNPSKSFNIISAPDLQNTDLPPVKYLVNDFLPVGTSLLAGAPKSGKSWIVLLMGLKIAAGEPFWCWNTEQAGVLYLSFEDSLSRLQGRMNKLLKGVPAPPWFYFSNDKITLEDDLLGVLNEHIKEHPEIKLVIIDTFAKIRGRPLPSERWYDHDYREAGMVKEFMDKYGISVLFVHHTNKTKDREDPFAEIAGTNGVSGVMDTMFVLKKPSRNAKQATLYTTGRDVGDNDYVLAFDDGQWEFVGEADDLKKQEILFDYQSSPVVKTIRALICESHENRWSGFAKNMLEAGDRLFQIPIAPSAQQLGKELTRLKDLLYERDKIVYTISPNGNAGNKHHFCYAVEAASEDTQPEIENDYPKL